MAGKISFWKRQVSSSQTVTTTVAAPPTETATITIPAAITYRVRLSTTTPEIKSVQAIPGITTIGELKKSIAKEFRIPAVRLKQNLRDDDIVTKHIDHKKPPLIVDIAPPRPESPPAYHKLDDEPQSAEVAPATSSPANAESALAAPQTPLPQAGAYEYNVQNNEAFDKVECQRNIVSREAPENAKTFNAHVNHNHARAGKQDNFNLDAKSLAVLINQCSLTEKALLSADPVV